MKRINSPWFCMIRCTIKTPNQEFQSVQGGRVGLEFPDDAIEALIEPIEQHRGNFKVLEKGKIWSAKWGVLSIEDHITKMQIEEERAAMEARQQEEAVRAENERKRKAREKKKEKEKEKEKTRMPSTTTENVPLTAASTEAAKD